MNFGEIDLTIMQIWRSVMKEVFRGREKELAILDKRYKKSGFSMVVLYGRRRIGKTMLINKFINILLATSKIFTFCDACINNVTIGSILFLIIS